MKKGSDGLFDDRFCQDDVVEYQVGVWDWTSRGAIAKCTVESRGFAKVFTPVSACLAAAFLAPVCPGAPMTSTHLCWELAQKVYPR